MRLAGELAGGVGCDSREGEQLEVGVGGVVIRMGEEWKGWSCSTIASSASEYSRSATARDAAETGEERMELSGPGK